MGDMYFKQAQYQKAIPYFKEATTQNPKLLHAFLLMGNAYYHLKDYQNALIYYAHILNQNPNHIDATYNTAEVYRLLGDKKKAAQWTAKYHALENRK